MTKANNESADELRLHRLHILLRFKLALDKNKLGLEYVLGFLADGMDDRLTKLIWKHTQVLSSDQDWS